MCPIAQPAATPNGAEAPLVRRDVGAIEIEIGIGIGIGIEKWRVKPMGLGHEKRDAYRLAIGDVA